MLFRDIKDGDKVWCLNRNTIYAYKATVKSAVVSYHRESFDCVVDICVETDGGNTQVFTLPRNSKIGYAQNWIITLSSDDMMLEVEKLKKNSEEILSATDRHKMIVSKCDGVLSELRLEKLREADFEGRLKAIEETWTKMEELLKGLKS